MVEQARCLVHCCYGSSSVQQQCQMLLWVRLLAAYLLQVGTACNIACVWPPIIACVAGSACIAAYVFLSTLHHTVHVMLPPFFLHKY
jgi:hypothetical protein